MFPQLDIKNKKLPADFELYFDEDGMQKKCHLDFFDEDWDAWHKRQREIAYSFMSDEEKKKYDEAIRHMSKKMQSSVGGTIFH